MEALVKTTTKKLESGVCFTSEELNLNGIIPTNLQCFTYYNYVLYEKGDNRIILKPLPHNLYKIIRTYKFIPA